MKIQVIIGSTREGRVSEKIAAWVMEKTMKHPEATFDLLDLRKYPMPFYEESVPAAMLTEGYVYKSKAANKWVKKIAEADGYLIITPEYNHGYSGVLKNALDYAYYQWHKKPVGFISYGSTANGARAVEQLRQVVIELQMSPIRESVHLPLFSDRPLFNTKGSITHPKYEKTLANTINQLLWYTQALKYGRETMKV